MGTKIQIVQIPNHICPTLQETTFTSNFKEPKERFWLLPTNSSPYIFLLSDNVVCRSLISDILAV